MNYCDDCGSKVYNGACTNCHEEIYIEQQYHELNMDTPNSIYEQSRKHEADIQRKHEIKETI